MSVRYIVQFQSVKMFMSAKACCQ